PALVIKIRLWPTKGGPCRDQLAPSRHWPFPSLLQLLAPRAAVTIRASENSVLTLAVADTNRPGATCDGKLSLKTPPASVAAAPLNRRVLPSPCPDGSTVESLNSSK